MESVFVLELSFTDDLQRLAARPMHRERLAQLHADRKLVMAGPWRDDTGALLIFRVEQQEMNEIVATDPYYATAGVKVVSLRPWQPIVGDLAELRERNHG